MKTVSLDFHDFSIYNNGFYWLEKIKDHYPQFKVSMFTIPFDYAHEGSELRLLRDEALKKVQDNLDWIQIIPHGLSHMEREFEKATRQSTKLALKAIGEAFKKDGLPYEKGFCAPYWLWNEEVISVLDDEGWWGAVDRNQPDMLKTKRYYTYTHSIDEPFWESKDEVLNLHGHMTPPSTNNLQGCFLNLIKLPPETKFKYVTDFIQG